MIYDVLHSNDKFVLNAAFNKTLNAEVSLQFQRFIPSNLIRNRNLNFQGTFVDDKRPKLTFPDAARTSSILICRIRQKHELEVTVQGRW